MNKWLLSIIGVVFLGVLLDLIYPNGKTNTLCKSIFGLFVVFVLISPILNIDINNYISDDKVSSVLVSNINKAKCEALELKIIKTLEDKNIKGVSVEIDTILNENIFEIQKIFVNTTNLVLTENVTNINKYEVIAKEISNIIEVDSSKVIVYG